MIYEHTVITPKKNPNGTGQNDADADIWYVQPWAQAGHKDANRRLRTTIKNHLKAITLAMGQAKEQSGIDQQ